MENGKLVNELESAILHTKSVIADPDTCESCRKDHEDPLELLEELKFRREHTDLLEDSDASKEYVFEDGRVLKAGQRYKHFKKGNIYIVVIPRVYDTEDMKEYVIYRGGDNKRRMWARPVTEFMSEVDRNKYPQATQQYRFELIEESDL